MRLQTNILSGLLLLLLSCQPTVSPIEYGMDNCVYCRMAIVDQKFAGELVTKKGKVFKFDATECMVSYMRSEKLLPDNLSMILTNTLDKPGELIHVEHCYFLQSDKMPSPMGKFINPFSDATLAMQYKDSHSGNIFQWDNIGEAMD